MVSSATVLDRAATVRGTFPKGRITVDQAIAMVHAMADSQVGYYTGNSKLSLYGNGQRWRTKGDWNWQGYWCARGISWVFDQCFGAKAAIAGIGRQPYVTTMPAGFAATWHWLTWFRENKRWVGLERAQLGDISLQSWGRTANETDHVELVTGPWNGKSYPCIGFNTVGSGTSGVTSGAGVWRVTRSRYALVGIYRPNWEALVAAYNSQITVPEPAPKPPPAPPVERVPNMDEFYDAGADRYETMAKAAVASGQRLWRLVGTEIDAVSASMREGAVVLIKDGRDDLPQSVIAAIIEGKPAEIRSGSGSSRVTHAALYAARKLAGLA